MSTLERVGARAVDEATAIADIGICHTLEERVPVDEYLSGITALAEFIGRYCGARK